jgi:hypothetical protein
MPSTWKDAFSWLSPIAAMKMSTLASAKAVLFLINICTSVVPLEPSAPAFAPVSALA